MGVFKSGFGVLSPWKLVSLGDSISILPLRVQIDNLCARMWSTAWRRLSSSPLPQVNCELFCQ